MPRRRNSSLISAPCRCEWRPSRWLAASQLALGALAPLAVVLSEMPSVAAWPLGLLAGGWAGVSAWRESKRLPVVLVVAPGSGPVLVDGSEVRDLSVRWQGPLVVIYWREEGRRRALLFWPDTLPAAQRRELYLAMEARRLSQLPPAVAP